MAPFRWPVDALEAQRGHLFTWVPVLLGVGIGGYFSLMTEPRIGAYAAVAVALLTLVIAMRLSSARLTPVWMIFFLVLLGFVLAGARAHLVAAPVLKFRYYGPIEGRIVTIDRSGSDKMRLTLDRVVLERTSPARTPARVRVSLHGGQGFIEPVPGMTVILTGLLGPPQGPVEPGGFDFRRMAWFKQLGAVGYTRSPVLALAPPARGRGELWVHRLRMRISGAVQAMMPGETGAFAAAILTGDRSGMGRETLTALRSSNLAHLLAISGLHMGLLTGFVFAAMRYALVAIPWIGLRVSVRKMAAIASLAAGGFYYLLSGGNVATERAYIMVSVMFIAVLFDRRAVTLRAVAIAAVIVLALRPESLTQPGFQMSFAATTGLVGAFGALRGWNGFHVPKLLRPVLAVVVSSAVAGAATAPVAAATFNRIADYGLLANLLSVPLMGAVVMPAAVLTACLAPFGLAWIGLALMGPAIGWILGVAQYVAGMEGAVTPVVMPQPVVMPVFALGMLWLILWQGRARLAGLAPVVLAFGIWSQAERPPVLISETGGLVGVMTDKGRVLSKPRGDGFAALSWLENDGDAALQQAAFGRAGLQAAKGEKRFELAGQRVVHLSGRGALGRVGAACREARLVIIANDVPKDASADLPCLVLDRQKLRKTGALAVYPEAGKLRLVGARDRGGVRLWSPR